MHIIWMPIIRLWWSTRHRNGQHNWSEWAIDILAFFFPFPPHFIICLPVSLSLSLSLPIFQVPSWLFWQQCNLTLYSFCYSYVICLSLTSSIWFSLSYPALSLQLPLSRSPSHLYSVECHWNSIYIFCPLLSRCFQGDILGSFPLRGRHLSWVDTRMMHTRPSSFLSVSELLDW